MYNPNTRLNVRSGAMRKYMAEHGDAQPEGQVPATLEELFDMLSSRTYTGNRAKELILQFVVHHRLCDADVEPGRPPLLSIFFRCLDRNLQSGFSAQTVHEIFDAGSALPEARVQSNDEVPGLRLPFEVALAQTLVPERMSAMHWGAPGLGEPSWFASRKIDGVRGIVLLDLALDAGAAHVSRVYALSRRGKPLHSLTLFCERLAAGLNACPAFQEAVQRDCVEGRCEPLTRVVLDGEICVVGTAEPGVAGEATEIMDDYRASSAALRRKNGPPIEDAVFFPFDFLMYENFASWRTNARQPRLARRVQTVADIVAWCRKNRPQTPLRALTQIPVHSESDVQRIIDEASAMGWEGVMLRENTPYEGKRTCVGSVCIALTAARRC